MMWKSIIGLFRKPTHPLKSKTFTDKDRINYWAYHHCERENAEWLGTDSMNICPLKGGCPGCQEKAREAVLKSG